MIMDKKCLHKRLDVVSGSRDSFTGNLLVKLRCRHCRKTLTKEYYEIGG